MIQKRLKLLFALANSTIRTARMVCEFRAVRAALVAHVTIATFAVAGAILSLAALSTGCGDDTTAWQGDGVPLNIVSASMEADAPQTVSAAQTVDAAQAVNKTALRSASALTTTDSIGVFLSGTGYEAKTNVAYNYVSATSWISTTPIYLYSATASVCAYYPYSASTTDATAVPLTSQLYSEAADLYYCPNKTVSSTSPSTTFTMTHAYAKMTFNITRDASYEGTGTISKIMIENANIVAGNTLNITAASTYGTPTVGLVSVSPSVTLPASGSGSSTVEVLMAPTVSTLTDYVVFSFTVDGETIVAALPASSNNLTSLAAANNYVVSATISGKSLVITHVAITEWADVAVTNTASSTSGSMVESNCYIVQPGGVVYIPVSRATAGQKVATSNSSYTLPTDWTTGLLWTDNSNGLSSSGAIASIVGHVGAGYITVTAGSAEGNSVIAIFDTDGSTILWSWHIWTTDEPATEMVNGNIWMDRNLGATARASNTSDTTFATCGGLLYQWGRKDPFPGSDGSTVGDDVTAKSIYNTSGVQLTNSNSTIPCPSSATYIGTTTVSYYDISSDYVSQCAYSINYPLSFFDHWAGSMATASINDTTAAGGKDSWGGEYGKSKSLFDPCPSGWRVPSGKKSSSTYASPWSTWATQVGFDTFAYAAALWNGTDNAYYYPAPGYRYFGSGAIYYVGRNGSYWSASTMNHQACCLYFGNSYVAQGNSLRRANGLSVRCVQE